jgi:hypothetical protein
MKITKEIRTYVEEDVDVKITSIEFINFYKGDDVFERYIAEIKERIKKWLDPEITIENRYRFFDDYYHSKLCVTFPELYYNSFGDRYEGNYIPHLFYFRYHIPKTIVMNFEINGHYYHSVFKVGKESEHLSAHDIHNIGYSITEMFSDVRHCFDGYDTIKEGTLTLYNNNNKEIVDKIENKNVHRKDVILSEDIIERLEEEVKYKIDKNIDDTKKRTSTTWVAFNSGFFYLCDYEKKIKNKTNDFYNDYYDSWLD